MPLKAIINHLNFFLGESKSYKRELIQSVSSTAFITFISMVLAFISSIILARSLTVEGYGAYSFIMSLTGSLALISYLGLPAMMTREIAKYNQSEKWGLIRGLIAKSHQFVICIAILLILLLTMMWLLFASSTESNDWRLLIYSMPLIPIIALTSLRIASLRGLKRVVMGAIPEGVVRPAIFLILLMFLTLIGGASVEAIIVAQIIAAFGALSVGVMLFRRVVFENYKNVAPEYETQEWKSLLLPFMGIASVSFLNVGFITIFLGFLGTNQDVAMYRIAVNVALVVALPLALIESVISPHITHLYSAGEIDKLRKLVQLGSLAALLISSLPALGLLFFGTEIIKLLYGIEYVEAYSTLVVIVIGYSIVNFVGLSMQLLYATEYHTTAFRLSVYGAVITVLICLLLIPMFGALGAGIALGFGKAIRSALFVVEARRRLNFKTSLVW